jgi:hypothetical protein
MFDISPDDDHEVRSRNKACAFKNSPITSKEDSQVIPKASIL